MQYMLLIYGDETADAAQDGAQQQATMVAYQAFTEGVIAQGKFKSADRLHPATTATTVRVQNGKTLATDGPFAETREQLGGYYIVDATDLDDAIAIAARIPGAKTGCVEVRPVFVFS
jgi:hypothetical protein